MGGGGETWPEPRGCPRAGRDRGNMMATMKGSFTADMPLELRIWSGAISCSIPCCNYPRGCGDVEPLIDEAAWMPPRSSSRARVTGSQVDVELDYVPRSTDDAATEIAHAEGTLRRVLEKYRLFLLMRYARVSVRPGQRRPRRAGARPGPAPAGRRRSGRRSRLALVAELLGGPGLDDGDRAAGQLDALGRVADEQGRRAFEDDDISSWTCSMWRPPRAPGGRRQMLARIVWRASRGTRARRRSPRCAAWSSRSLGLKIVEPMTESRRQAHVHNAVSLRRLGSRLRRPCQESARRRHTSVRPPCRARMPA